MRLIQQLLEHHSIEIVETVEIVQFEIVHNYSITQRCKLL